MKWPLYSAYNWVLYVIYVYSFRLKSCFVKPSLMEQQSKTQKQILREPNK